MSYSDISLADFQNAPNADTPTTPSPTQSTISLSDFRNAPEVQSQTQPAISLADIVGPVSENLHATDAYGQPLHMKRAFAEIHQNGITDATQMRQVLAKWRTLADQPQATTDAQMFSQSPQGQKEQAAQQWGQKVRQSPSSMIADAAQRAGIPAPQPAQPIQFNPVNSPESIASGKATSDQIIQEAQAKRDAEANKSFTQNTLTALPVASNNVIAGMIKPFSPDTAKEIKQRTEETYGHAAPGSVGEAIGSAVGGALPIVSSMAIGKGVRAAEAVGGLMGMGGAASEVEDARSRGINVSGGQEIVSTLVGGGIGAATGRLQGALMSGPGGKVANVIGNQLSGVTSPLVGRVAGAVVADSIGNAIVNPAARIAENFAIQKNYDPNRELTHGLGVESTAQDLLQGVVFAPMTAHHANAQYHTETYAKSAGIDPKAVQIIPSSFDNLKGKETIAKAMGAKKVVFVHTTGEGTSIFDKKTGTVYVNVNQLGATMHEGGHAAEGTPLWDAASQFVNQNPELRQWALSTYAADARKIGMPELAADVEANPDKYSNEIPSVIFEHVNEKDVLAKLKEQSPGLVRRIGNFFSDVAETVSGGDPKTRRLIERQMPVIQSFKESTAPVYEGVANRYESSGAKNTDARNAESRIMNDNAARLNEVAQDEVLRPKTIQEARDLELIPPAENAETVQRTSQTQKPLQENPNEVQQVQDQPVSVQEVQAEAAPRQAVAESVGKPNTADDANAKEVAKAGAAPTPKAKEPWEMTSDEYVKGKVNGKPQWGNSPYAKEMGLKETPWQADDVYRGMATHAMHIREAIRNGNPVPAEVLKDYPDLATKYANTKETIPLDSKSNPLGTLTLKTNLGGRKIGESLPVIGEKDGKPVVMIGGKERAVGPKSGEWVKEATKEELLFSVRPSEKTSPDDEKALNTAEAVKRVMMAARTQSRGEKPVAEVVHSISPESGHRDKLATGIDTSGLPVVLDEDLIRKNDKARRNPKIAADHGFIPVADEEYAKIPEIHDTADVVALGGKRPDGTPTIEYLKRENGHYYLSDSYRNAKGELRVARFVKLPKESDIVARLLRATPEGGVAPTSETTASNDTHSENIVPSSAKVNEKTPDILRSVRPAETAGIPDDKIDSPSYLASARKQWVEKGTESPFFKRWFKDSKVVDEQGKPLVVHHGTDANFDTFDIEKAGSKQYSDWGKGVYLTPRKSKADYYRVESVKKMDKKYNDAFERYERLDRGTKTVNGVPQYSDEAIAALKEFQRIGKEKNDTTSGKVFDLYANINNPYIQGYSMPDPGLAEFAKSKGHDGIFVLNGNGGIEEIIAFDPSQIKSATGNRGTFDPADANINRSVRPSEKRDDPRNFQYLGHPDTGKDYFSITPKDAEGMPRNVIRLLTGWQDPHDAHRGFGAAHIESHMNEGRLKQFDSAEDFVAHVLKDWNPEKVKILDDNGRLRIVRRNGGQMVMGIELRKQDGGYYSVVNGYEARSDKDIAGKQIWPKKSAGDGGSEPAPSSPESTGLTSDVSTPGISIKSAQGRNTDRSEVSPADNNIVPSDAKVNEKSPDIQRSVRPAENAKDKPETIKEAIGYETGLLDASGSISRKEALRGSFIKAYRAAKAGYKQGVTDLTGLKEELVRQVAGNLPSELHGRFLDDVAKATTTGDIAKSVSRASQLLGNWDVRHAVQEMEDFAGKLVIKMPESRKVELDESDSAEELGRRMVEKARRHQSGEDIRKIDLKTLSNENLVEAKKLIADAKAIKEMAKSAKTLPEKYEAVQKAGNLLAELRQIAANDRAEKEMRITGGKISKEKAIQDSVKRLAKGTQLNDNNPGQEKQNANISVRAFRKMMNRTTMIDALLGNDSSVRKLHDAYNDEGYIGFANEMRLSDEASEKAYAKAGLSKNSAKFDDFINKKEEMVLPDAGKVQLTRSEQATLVGAYGDENVRSDVNAGKALWNLSTDKDAKPFKLSVNDMEAIQSRLSKGELDMIADMKSHFDSLFPKSREANLRIFGSAPFRKVAGYFPSLRNMLKSPVRGEPADWRKYVPDIISEMSFMQDRTGGNTPRVIKGIHEVFEGHTRNAAKLIHILEPVRNLAMVVQNPAFREAVRAKYGDRANEHFTRMLQDAAMVEFREENDPVTPTVRLMQRRFARAMLQANPVSMAMNIVPGSMVLQSEFAPQDYAHGVKKMFDPETRKRMKETGIGWQRYHNGVYGSYYSQLSGGTGQSARLSMSEASASALKSLAHGKFKEASKNIGQLADALPFMQESDATPVALAFAASEHEVNRLYPDMPAKQKARKIEQRMFEAIRKTQNGSTPMELSDVASQGRRSSLASSFLMFTSDSNKKFNMIVGAKDGKQMATNAAIVAASVLAGSAIRVAFRKAPAAVGRAITGAEKPEGEDSELLAYGARDFLSGMASSVYGGDRLVQAIGNIASGRAGYSPIDTPPERVLEDLMKHTTDLSSATQRWFDEDPDKAKLATGKFLQALGNIGMDTANLTGMPVTPAANIVKRAAKAGSYGDEEAFGGIKSKIDAVERDRNLYEKTGNAEKLQSLADEKGVELSFSSYANDVRRKINDLQDKADSGDKDAKDEIESMSREFNQAYKSGDLPQEWKVENEFHALNAKASAYRDARKKYSELAAKGRNAEGLALLRKAKITENELKRLRRLTAVRKQIKVYRDKVKNGEMGKYVAEIRIKKLLQYAKE